MKRVESSEKTVCCSAAEQPQMESTKTSGHKTGELSGMPTRYVYGHRNVDVSKAANRLQCHTFHELICCRTNYNLEYLVGTDRCSLQKGDIIWIAPGVSHRPILPETMTDPCMVDMLWLSTEFVEAIACLIPEWHNGEERSYILHRTARTSRRFLVDLIHNSIDEIEQRASGWELIVAGNAMAILAQLWRSYTDVISKQDHMEKPELLDRVVTYIEENLEEKITLRDVAQRLYVSESTISHVFQEKMGTSFYRYVIQRRLVAAKNLISEGKPMEWIAEQVGFSAYSAFYRAFRKEYGISPKAFRVLQEDVGEAELLMQEAILQSK